MAAPQLQQDAEKTKRPAAPWENKVKKAGRKGSGPAARPFTLMEMRPSHGRDAEFESGNGLPHRLVRSGRKTRSAKASHAKQTRKELPESVCTPC